MIDDVDCLAIGYNVQNSQAIMWFNDDNGISVNAANYFDWNGDMLATQPWVQSNQKYTITVSSGVMTVKENY